MPDNNIRCGLIDLKRGAAIFFKQSYLLAILVAILLAVGCQNQRGSTTVLEGRLESKGKAVFPAVVMLQDSASSSGGLTGNTNNEGVFKIYNVERKNYRVAVEPIRLSGITQAEREAPAEPRLDPDGYPIREETVPAAFQSAYIDFPEKYFRFETSGLTIDCSQGIPSEPVTLKLD